ncbi:nitroreductase family protein [Alkalilacustris brevis]|uniref:nitroreductase family protein n=1 Tax=Alkalilacustris brevis TaxID=2026338 RepID=UPI000E0CE6EA|nr:nitroreductase [Alkalilacustris brevis]
MPQPAPAVLDFLQRRRSCPAKMLGLPVPGREDLMPLLQAAARSPDHGKLEPWRFIVLERRALQRLAALAGECGHALGLAPEQVEKGVRQYGDAHLAVAVVASPRASEKIPQIEQHLSAGAVCLALLNAALAAGWGGNWLSGFASHDRKFCEIGLGLAEGEFIAGMIHIGTAPAQPVPERPRPDLEKIVQWVAE